jgi:hypothetical protein
LLNGTFPPVQGQIAMAKLANLIGAETGVDAEYKEWQQGPATALADRRQESILIFTTDCFADIVWRAERSDAPFDCIPQSKITEHHA